MTKSCRRVVLLHVPAMALLALSACFMTADPTLLWREQISSETNISAPTKAHILDTSVILLPGGFTVKNDTVIGSGTRHWSDGVTPTGAKSAVHRIALDSVAAMTYYELNASPQTQSATGLLVLYGGAITVLLIRCLMCPKCCFGSCPTVYTRNDGEFELEAELFSYNISKYTQDEDLDRLTPPSKHGMYQVRLANEALETHYIDRLALTTVVHPPGTQIFPTSLGGFVATGDPRPVTGAISSAGEDVSALVAERDEQVYRTDPTTTQKAVVGSRDYLYLELEPVYPADEIKLILRLKNTLLSTILFYDIVLASQGIEALEWTERMNTDPVYAALLDRVYKSYSGVRVQVLVDGTWKERASIGDIGPIAWKDLAVEVPVDGGGDEKLRLRLAFFPDNIMVDYVGWEAGDQTDAPMLVKEVGPATIRDAQGRDRAQVGGLIREVDGEYLVTEPGEVFDLSYEIPQTDGQETAVFIASQGYYIEWLRGDWLKPRQSGYRFSLFNTEETIAQMTKSWAENRDLIEQTFLETRIRPPGDR